MPEVWKSYGLTASTNGQLFSRFLARVKERHVLDAWRSNT